jgi:tetratricopeptide (TPR) repeat protein
MSVIARNTPRSLSPKVQASRLFRAAKRLAADDRYTSALAALQQAIELYPTAAEIWDYRGVLLSLMDRTQEALESFASALSLTGSAELQAQIYFHRGLLHGRDQAYAQAHEDLVQAQRLCPANATYREAVLEIEKEWPREVMP